MPLGTFIGLFVARQNGDLDEAMGWFRRAAAQGAGLYQEGVIVDAYHWRHDQHHGQYRKAVEPILATVEINLEAAAKHIGRSARSVVDCD